MQVNALPRGLTDSGVGSIPGVPVMSQNASRRWLSLEWSLVVLIPVLTVVAGAAMIHVASSFGFTALGEPAVAATAAPARAAR
jgi:uncharacterized protein (UPF0333 family)